MAEAARRGDIFCTATGDKNVIRREHFEVMKDGAIIANTGHFNVEIDIPALQEMATKGRSRGRWSSSSTCPTAAACSCWPRAGWSTWPRPRATRRRVMDMSFANQALSAEYVVKNHADLEAKVYVVPKDLDDEVARLKLASMGVEIDSLTAEQQKYLSSWDEGT